ncbi:MAG: hypothetical protein AAFY25_09500 [Pseudomonadota bacterium]
MAVVETKSQVQGRSLSWDPGNTDNVISFPIRSQRTVIEEPQLQLSDRHFQIVETLRKFVIESQLCSRSKLVHTCAIVQPVPERELRETALVFLGVLSEFANQRLTFLSPGARSVSDTEHWVVRLIDAYAQSDTPAGRALIGWRVKPEAHRRTRFLAGRLAEALMNLRQSAAHQTT